MHRPLEFLIFVVFLKCLIIGGQIQGESDAICKLNSVPLHGWDCSQPSHSVCNLTNPNRTLWSGIKCISRSVVEININNHGLDGTLSPSLGDLKDLKLLSLHSNYLHGSIPTAFGKLQYLETFVIYSNAFSGALPQTLCDNPLQTLLIQHNSGLTCYPSCLSSVTGFDPGNISPCPSPNPTLTPTFSPTETPIPFEYHTSETSRSPLSQQEIIIISVLLSFLGCFVISLLAYLCRYRLRKRLFGKDELKDGLPPAGIIGELYPEKGPKNCRVDNNTEISEGLQVYV